VPRRTKRRSRSNSQGRLISPLSFSPEIVCSTGDDLEIPVLRVGAFELDAVRHRVIRAGVELKLTPKESESF
jgi:DNA-binding response OmpR family regulator